MKLLVISDVHMDFYFQDSLSPFEKVPEDQLRCITHCMLAGDLTNKGHKNWKACLRWIAERLPNAQIFVMPGNHDYYDGCLDEEHKLRDAAVAHGATFIQKSELIFGKHRFLCCTLWTDFNLYGDRPHDMRRAHDEMNDYEYIRIAAERYKKLTPTRTAALHVDHREWLGERLSEVFDGETTVITHHAPHVDAIPSNTNTGPFYASDLEAMILKYQPARWIYGHTHHRVVFNVGQTTLTNVSIGYPGQLDLIDNLAPFTFDLEE